MHFLKFEDESQAREVMATYIHEHNWQTASHSHALDPIGVIYKPTGEVIDDHPIYAPLDGYHVNFVGDVSAFSQYEVFPETPSRVFA